MTSKALNRLGSVVISVMMDSGHVAPPAWLVREPDCEHQTNDSTARQVMEVKGGMIGRRAGPDRALVQLSGIAGCRPVMRGCMMRDHAVNRRADPPNQVAEAAANQRAQRDRS